MILCCHYHDVELEQSVYFALLLKSTADQLQQSCSSRFHENLAPSRTPDSLTDIFSTLRKAAAYQALPSHDAGVVHSRPHSLNSLQPMLKIQPGCHPDPALNVLCQQILHDASPTPNSVPSLLSSIQATRAKKYNLKPSADAGDDWIGALLHQQRDPSQLPTERQASTVVGKAAAVQSYDTSMVEVSATALARQSSSDGEASHSTIATAAPWGHLPTQQVLLQQCALDQQQQHKQQQAYKLQLLCNTLAERNRVQQENQRHSSALHHRQNQFPSQLNSTAWDNPWQTMHVGSRNGASLNLRQAVVEQAPWLAGFACVQNRFDNPACNTLFIGNLGDEVDEGELYLLLSLQPGFKQIKLVRKPRQVRCFVENDLLSSKMSQES